MTTDSERIERIGALACDLLTAIQPWDTHPNPIVRSAAVRLTLELAATLAASEIQASETKSAGGDTSTIRADLDALSEAVEGWGFRIDPSRQERNAVRKALDRLAARLKTAERDRDAANKDARGSKEAFADLAAWAQKVDDAARLTDTTAIGEVLAVYMQIRIVTEQGYSCDLVDEVRGIESELGAAREALRDARGATALLVRAADRIAVAVQHRIALGHLDARSEAGDALLDYAGLDDHRELLGIAPFAVLAGGDTPCEECGHAKSPRYPWCTDDVARCLQFSGRRALAGEDNSEGKGV